MTHTKPQFLNSLKRASCGACGKPKLALLGSSPFLVLLVKDSEYSTSAGTKPILSLSCIYLVSPGALLLLLRQLRIFAAAAFSYFWLAIQNTADRQVRNLFCLLAVFISFPWRAAAARAHPVFSDLAFSLNP
jgi:hypothetical protein